MSKTKVETLRTLSEDTLDEVAGGVELQSGGHSRSGAAG